MTEYQKKYLRLRYQRLLDEKRCGKCGRQDEKTLNGYSTCGKCAEYMKAWYEKRKEKVKGDQ